MVLLLSSLLNAGRPNRKSNVGYWKETGKSRQIITQLPNGVTGKRRIFVFYKGLPSGVNTKCVMHEFSAAISPPNNQRTFVLCKIMKRAITVPTYDEGETSGTPKSAANDEVPGEVDPYGPEFLASVLFSGWNGQDYILD